MRTQTNELIKHSLSQNVFVLIRNPFVVSHGDDFKQLKNRNSVLLERNRQ